MRYKYGFVKIWRSAVESDLIQHNHSFKVFIWLIMQANIKDGKTLLGQQIPLKRGELATSYQEIAEALGIGIRSVRTSLSYLKKTQRIDTRSDTHGTVIRLLNYCKYQDYRHTGDMRVDTRPTHDRHTTDNIGKKKEYKNIRSIRRGESFDCLSTAWMKACPPFKPIKSLTKDRLNNIQSRLAEQSNPEYWEDTMQRLLKSSFCKGSNKRNWIADFDWFLKPETHIKINEGKYDDSPNKGELRFLKNALIAKEMLQHE